MRFSPLAVLAGLTAFAYAEEETNPVTDPTTFNGVSVPPLLELSPTTWEEELKKNKFLMVKHFRYLVLLNHRITPAHFLSARTANTAPTLLRRTRPCTNSTIPRNPKPTASISPSRSTTTLNSPSSTALLTMISAWIIMSCHTRLQFSMETERRSTT